VPPAAQWCSLCYTDLRPAPAPAAAAAPAPAPAPAPAAAAAQPVTGRVAVADPPAEEPSWPCRSCGALVRFELMSCSECGAPFLVDPDPDDRLTGRVSQLAEMSGGRKAAIIVGGAVVVAAVLLALFFLIGLFL
jgi:hypothetical protein